MKQFLVCLLLLVGIACKTADSTRRSDVQAVVAKVEGSSEFLAAGQTVQTGQIRNEQAVAVGHALRKGDQIRTGADGRVDVQLIPYGGVMSVMPNSAIEIEQLGPEGTAGGTAGTNQQTVAAIRLTRGRVVGDTLKLPKGSKVVVKTNAGTFAIP